MRQTGVICKGCYALGSACGRCERCIEERMQLIADGKIEGVSDDVDHRAAMEYYHQQREAAKIERQKTAIQETFNTYSSAEMRKMEEDFDQKAIEIFSCYKEYEHFEPRFPNVLVRILPKTLYAMSGRIIIPDVKENNKPTYEGIVLRTWKEHTLLPRKGDLRLFSIQSALKPGDHVLFPHFAGQPLPGLDQDKYRSIPEGISKSGAVVFGNDVGCIIGTLNYQRENIHEVFERVYQRHEDYFQKVPSESARQYRDELFSMLSEEFDLIVKQKHSLTKSGV